MTCKESTRGEPRQDHCFAFHSSGGVDQRHTGATTRQHRESNNDPKKQDQRRHPPPVPRPPWIPTKAWDNSTNTDDLKSELRVRKHPGWWSRQNILSQPCTKGPGTRLEELPLSEDSKPRYHRDDEVSSSVEWGSRRSTLMLDSTCSPPSTNNQQFLSSGRRKIPYV